MNSLKQIIQITFLGFVLVSARTQDEGTPARYALGTIPDQSVWSGSSRSFVVYAPGGGALSLVADPAPAGLLTVEPNSNGDYLFRYVPALQDVRPFRISVASASSSQTFVMTPELELPPETSVFASDQHTRPTISTHEVEVTDLPSVLPEEMNYRKGIVSQVQIVGETVIIEAKNENGLYEAYFNGDRRDIKSMEIIAERIIIRSPVRLKQTDVTLSARELVFENQGQLKTTPEEILTSAGVNSSGGLDGANGLPAGNLTLHVSHVVGGSSELLFDLTGGRGQPGGPGQHGAPGSSISTYYESARVCDSGICKTYSAPKGSYITYYYYTFAGATISEKGTKTWPGNGTNAKPSGKPGEGGAGGNLRTTVPLEDLFSTAGGPSAQPSRANSPPYDKFQGGAAGFPTKSEHVQFYVEFFQMKAAATPHTSTKGKDAVLQVAKTAAGTAGKYELMESDYSWLHPLALRKRLNHIQEDFLANQIDPAREALEDYDARLASFEQSPEWQMQTAATQAEFSQMHGEIRLLLQRIAGGLDYFGNPAGWVPMLSFEVTKDIFQSEIDSAINTLYLTYWIGNIAKTEQHRVDALSRARDQLREELSAARENYDDAVKRLPGLLSKAQDLESRIQTTQNSLEAEEIKLLNDTREPSFVTGLRLGLKISAMICQMVPVYQPALGAVGEGIRVASDFDPKRPWETIKGLGNIGTTYSASPFASSANETKAAKNGIDPAQAESKGIDYVKSLQQAGAGMQQGLADLRKFIDERKAPSAEMLAELKRLKAKSPVYNKLLEEVEALMTANRAFTEEALATMQAIASLSDVMARDILAIDAFNREIAPGQVVIDERASAYLEDMERRAYNRLLKYHYYMAKAYEYRLLKPYTQPLNLEGLFKKFEAIASLDSAEITPAQFDSLRQVYEDLIRNIAESIYDSYINGRTELSSQIRFGLSDDEVATLNTGGTVTLNLHDLGLIPLAQENARIVDFKIFEITAGAEGGGSVGSTAYIDLQMEHAGISNLRSDGNIYRFRHYNRLTRNPIVWGGRYDVVSDRVDPIGPSAASDSLLRSLLTGDAASDMLLYSRPSGWGDIYISRRYFDSAGRTLLIKSLRFEVVYDFVPRDDSLGLRNVEVFAAEVQPQANEMKTLDTQLQPLFLVDREDLNARQSARGQFVRTYRKGDGKVSIAAPAQYGALQFHRWTDRFGRDLPGGPFTDPTLDVNLQDDSTVLAQFVSGTPAELELQPPILSNHSITLRWNGADGVRLQTSPNVIGPWTDIPDSTAKSELTVQADLPVQYFRTKGP